MESNTNSGPYETEDQAREAVRAIYDAAHASTRRGVMAEGSHQRLDDACTAAGVELGAYDKRILIWLSGWEPQTCAVIAGLITRAAGADAGRARNEPVPAEEAEDDLDLDPDATELTDEQARELLGDDPWSGHAGDWEFWKPALRGALQDAIAYWTPRSGDEETADAITLWRRCARDLGLDLGAGA